MSDDSDSKVEEINDVEDKLIDSKPENEEEGISEMPKANNKVAKKKAPAPVKTKVPAKKRGKEQIEKEVEKLSIEEDKNHLKDESLGSDEDEEDHKPDNKKGLPLLDQPLEITGSRERKQVERFSVIKTENDEQKALIIPEGNGTPLGEIPGIEHNLQRYNIETLKPLHKICFNRVGKPHVIKKNIRKFNGYDFKKDSTEYEKKKQVISKLPLKDLKTISIILDLDKSKKKDEIVQSILNFLVTPEDSGKPVPEGRSKRKTTTLKSYAKSDTPSEENLYHKKKKSPKRKMKSLVEESHSESDNQDGVDANDENHSKSENDVESEEYDEEPKKKKVKKAAQSKEKKSAAPPKKRAAAAAKKKASESDDEVENESGGESDESDKKPLAKKNKPPSEDEIKAYVKSILEGANLEEITMKTVCKQVYSHYPEFDLGHKKDFIKTTVKSLISS
uniref:DEK-C domain-containing protein n=1 Tax=Clastoptera arizonana TaxID=38151 RepID=A0A1B6CRB1_9HEMI